MNEDKYKLRLGKRKTLKDNAHGGLWFSYWVKPTEIPEYAGLIYVEGDNIEIIKKAPKLHNFKANETLIRTVCSLLSTRTLFGGCSYIKFLNGKH